MGPYCKFCGRRCFVPRTGAQMRTATILATCQEGMAHDLRTSGYTHRTAINPTTHTRDELAEARQIRITDHPHPYTGTVTAVLATRTFGALVDKNLITNAAIDTLVGLPTSYDVRTRKRLHA